ncbi:MAG: Gfo/Idh/MocA family oxidoreductase [Planctomycetes bacterium]|nr:Gfo/Idh/MocA family oxidoreductase [Planctomycetota bacterium]
MSQSKHNRRTFLRNSTAAAAALTAATGYAIPTVHTGASGPLKVGLIGCGGRGTGAAAQALRADPDTVLWAMGDAFSDMLESHLQSLMNSADIADRINVPKERQFSGFDAYQKVIDECDVILLATSPHFRPLHVEYAVEKNRHLFIEKPVATDVPGLRRIQAACARGKEKGLSMVSGLCYRYQFAKQETFKRLHDGDIGEIRALQCTYNTGGLWHRGNKPEWSQMEYQMRNWLYFTWLSGDHIAEQHIHSLDKVLWAMKDEAPVKCSSTGGRILRTDEKYGNVYDHFNTVYEWANGVKAFSSCRQIPGTSHDVSDYAFGTKGTASLQSHRIDSEAGKWRYRGDGPDDMYQNEHDALFASIRSNNPIDNSDYMVKSTMMAIIARMSAYTGQTITWEQAWNSKMDLAPPAYDWINDMPTDPVSLPGVAKFV